MIGFVRVIYSGLQRSCMGFSINKRYKLIYFNYFLDGKNHSFILILDGGQSLF